EQWPCPIVPILVNVLQYPQPTAARCYELGKAIGKAVEAYPEDLKVAIFGTGGMSHQLAGTRAGFINEEFDRDFLEKIETDPDALAKLTREELIELAGTEGLELIMWLVMRGAIGDSIRRVADTYFVPASNTAAGAAVFERVSPTLKKSRTPMTQAPRRDRVTAQILTHPLTGWSAAAWDWELA